jgi:hypothetical protein
MQLTNLSPQQLRKAADLQERIQSLQQELSSLLDVSEEARPVSTGGKKRTMSSAGRAAIAAAARARWAKIKRQGKPAGKGKAKRVMSAAGRARLAEAARERWKKAKAAGKSSL